MIIEARDDVVQIEGALDKNQWPVIQAAANLLLRQHSQGIIVDGAGLTRCSPEGAQTFRDAMDYIERYKARIVVCGLPESVMDVVRAVPGVRSRLPVAASVEEARASLGMARSGGTARAGGRRVLQDILVPLLSAATSEAATALACRLAKADGQKARIHLSYIFEVPRHLPLTAVLPEDEAAAGAMLEAAEKQVRRAGLAAVQQVSRARDAAEQIAQEAEQSGANMIVIAYAPSDDPAHDPIAAVIKTVLERASCEVVLSKRLKEA